MLCGMRKTRKIIARRYTDRLIDIDEYLSTLTGSKERDNIGNIDLNEIIENIITNGWFNQAYVQGFDCETITKQIC